MLFLEARDFDVKRRILTFQIDLAANRNFVDQFERSRRSCVQHFVERTIVDHSAYIEKLLSNLMLYFLERTFYVEVLIFVQKLIHCAAGTVA